MEQETLKAPIPPKKKKKKKKKIIKKRRKTNYTYHLIFFAVVLVLFIFAIIKFVLWSKGETSDYNPNEVTTEFDIETMDHIQPMDSSRFEGVVDDGVTTILCLGNSPFADNKGENGLAQTIAQKMKGVAYDGSFANSYQSMSSDSSPEGLAMDGLSLYPVVSAICSGDFSIVETIASATGETEVATVEMLKSLDYSKVDMLLIMYDLSDYISQRPLFNPDSNYDLTTWGGALYTSLELIEENYPHIRTVVLSMPAGGKTVDGSYVDGDQDNLGNGTLPDYLNISVSVAIDHGVSFMDNYYGVINADNKDEFLADEYHLNEKGIEAIANHFCSFFGKTKK